MSDPSVTVKLDTRLAPVFVLVGAVLGLAASFAVGPVVGWLLDTVDGAPAPLRLVDQLPLGWAIPLLTLVGAAAGWFVFTVWGKEVGEVRVNADQILITGSKAAAAYTREEISEIFLDKDELVLLGTRSNELSRTPSDAAVAQQLKTALERFDYPWAGTSDPRDAEFTGWVDRSPQLETRAHELLRQRRRALADGRTGTAEETREQLLGLGIVVRDRGDQQQYRRIE